MTPAAVNLSLPPDAFVFLWPLFLLGSASALRREGLGSSLWVTPAWQGVAESARSRRPVNPRPAPSSRKRDSRVVGMTARLIGFGPGFLRPRRGGHSQKEPRP
jgi:hypothetical protein